MRDPLRALDLDLAIAARARTEISQREIEILESSDGNGFHAAVLTRMGE